MMTEDEARTKWCLMMAMHDLLRCDETCRHKPEDYAPGINSARCIASDCMAWRWYESDDFKCLADKEFQKTGKRLQPKQGFCGLAGRP